MFTGIIKEICTIKKKFEQRAGIGFLIAEEKIKTKEGASIAVNGVCLTVTKKIPSGFFVDVVRETLKCTNLGRLSTGARVNLEPSMRASDRFHGHFVMGHVDCIGLVKKINHRKEITISIPKKLMKYIVEKGSVAVNGVSLTVASTSKNTFTIALIPFTEKHTNLGMLEKGDTVNIEVDIIARYLVRTM